MGHFVSLSPRTVRPLDIVLMSANVFKALKRTQHTRETSDGYEEVITLPIRTSYQETEVCTSLAKVPMGQTSANQIKNVPEEASTCFS